MKNQRRHSFGNQSGVTIVELMVALAIGSFLMIGAIQVYNQSRQAYIINDSIARVQETAQFAMDTLEADLRMASNWGMHSRGQAVDGRSTIDDANPMDLGAPVTCGDNWALNLGRPVEGQNNDYTLACGANGGAQAQSDVLTVRRATVAAVPLEAGRLQIQTTRMQGQIFDDGTVPTGIDPLMSETHNLIVNSYYVSADSDLIPGVPALRRKSLNATAGVTDQEIAPGVENLQVQFGLDVDADNTVDRYVNPDDAVLDPADGAFIPGARVITARVWMVVRSLGPENGLQDARDYEPGDVDLGVQNDENRRLLVSKTILLRNARS